MLVFQIESINADRLRLERSVGELQRLLKVYSQNTDDALYELKCETNKLQHAELTLNTQKKLIADLSDEKDAIEQVCLIRWRILLRIITATSIHSIGQVTR
jgi:hypothetical protein